MATTRPDGHVTIADVARRAGVSQMTVSRVINSSAAVRPDKRQRVERAIEELGYVPNRLARGLSARRLGVIAVLVPDLTNPFFTEIEWMAAEGIASGFPGGLYKPQDPVKRQQMANFLLNLMNGPGVDLD